LDRLLAAADPVHLDCSVISCVWMDVEMSSADAYLFCASLNAHFVTKGWSFLRPIRNAGMSAEHSCRKFIPARFPMLGANVLGFCDG